jgi:hypothetical protein
VLPIASLVTPPFQIVCGNAHIADVIISPMSSVHYNVYCSKINDSKIGFFS